MAPPRSRCIGSEACSPTGKVPGLAEPNRVATGSLSLLAYRADGTREGAASCPAPRPVEPAPRKTNHIRPFRLGSARRRFRRSRTLLRPSHPPDRLGLAKSSPPSVPSLRLGERHVQAQIGGSSSIKHPLYGQLIDRTLTLAHPDHRNITSLCDATKSASTTMFLQLSRACWLHHEIRESSYGHERAFVRAVWVYSRDTNEPDLVCALALRYLFLPIVEVFVAYSTLPTSTW